MNNTKKQYEIPIQNDIVLTYKLPKPPQTDPQKVVMWRETSNLQPPKTNKYTYLLIERRALFWTGQILYVPASRTKLEGATRGT